MPRGGTTGQRDHRRHRAQARPAELLDDDHRRRRVRRAGQAGRARRRGARVDAFGHLAEQALAARVGIGRDVRREDERRRCRRACGRWWAARRSGRSGGRGRRRCPRRSRARAGSRRRTSRGTPALPKRRALRCVGEQLRGRGVLAHCGVMRRVRPASSRRPRTLRTDPFEQPHERAAREHGQHRVDRRAVARDAEAGRGGDRDRRRDREERQDRDLPPPEHDEPDDRRARAAGSTRYVARRDCQTPRPSSTPLSWMFWPGRKRSHMRATRSTTIHGIWLRWSLISAVPTARHATSCVDSSPKKLMSVPGMLPSCALRYAARFGE